MEGLSPALITAALAPTPANARVLVAYSGGVDSHVLLHLAASIAPLRGNITAVYVHHGLQEVASDWAVHCGQVAEGLGVGFAVLTVNAHPKAGESPEEAARNARYQALKALLQQDDVVLVAQHREDQLETVLLQLFRGSGLRGLSGMPARMAFGEGFLLRPLLTVAKPAIDQYARSHGLCWVEDPTNWEDDYDRNFLRNGIVPLLKQRWPALDKTVARAADHCAEAEAMLGGMAGQWAAEAIDPNEQTLSIQALLTHPEAGQKLLIRHWLQGLGLKMPSQAVVSRLRTEVLAARVDANPVLSTPDYCLRRYQDKLYCLRPRTAAPYVGPWPKGLDSVAINAWQRLVCVPSAHGIAKALWDKADVDIRARTGGEKIRLPYRQGRHSLKKLFQEAGVPPWEREWLPLVYLDGQLAAVGGRWLSAEFYSEGSGGCVGLVLQSANV